MQVLFAYRDTFTANDRIHNKKEIEKQVQRLDIRKRVPKRPYFAVQSFGLLQCPSSIRQMYATRRARCLSAHYDV